MCRRNFQLTPPFGIRETPVGVFGDSDEGLKLIKLEGGDDLDRLHERVQAGHAAVRAEVQKEGPDGARGTVGEDEGHEALVAKEREHLEERHDGVVDALDVTGGDSYALRVDVERIRAADLVASGLDH